MKAIIRLDIPKYQIGQEVFCYFNDSMTVKGICEEDNTEEIERFAIQQLFSETSEDSRCDSCDYDYDPRSGECYDCVKGNDERYVTAEEYSTWDKFTLNDDEQEPCVNKSTKSTISQGFSQDDCISRQAVLDTLKEWNGERGYNWTSLYFRVNDLPSVTPVQKWVPVKTRPLDDEEKEYYSEHYDFSDIEDMFIYDCQLPEDGQDVLITTCCDNVILTTFYADEGCYFESYEESDDVKAWMPLSKPYKAESGE